MITFTKTLIKRINEVNDIINDHIKEDFYAIECDSTWESQYNFYLLDINKKSVTLTYQNIDYRKNPIIKETIRDIEDLKYYLTWIKKCIKKGRKEK